MRWLRWIGCLAPTLVFIVFELTPGLSGLNGINAAALFVMSPVLLLIGFAYSVACVFATRFIVRKFSLRSKVWFALLILLTFSPIAYLGQDWRLLLLVVLASLPAALLLGPSDGQAGTAHA